MIASNDSRGWAQSGTIRQSGDYTHHFTQWKKGGSFEHHTFIHYQHLFGGEVHQYWSPYLTSCNCIAMRVDTSQYATTDFNPNGYWAGPWLTEYAGEVTVDGSDVPGNPTDRVGFGHMQSQS